MVDSVEEHEMLVQALLDDRAWPQGGDNRQRVDSHISTVVLAGNDAYKLKKPLNLGYLDYTTLDKRKHACEEEVRLNRRLAPQIYLRALAVTGSENAPRLGGEGEVIDWAVHMYRFDPDAILSNQVDKLDRGLVEKLAWRIERFHREAARCPDASHYGTPDASYAAVVQIISQIKAHRSGDHVFLDHINDWIHKRIRDLREIQYQRRNQGHVRECHGYLYLGNIALIDGEPVVFAGIDFGPELRWIDTMSDVAFLTMDLIRVGRIDLARTFLDSYFELSGDYDGLSLLRYYAVYSALVRAKVAANRITERDLTSTERERQLNFFRRYMRLAEAFTHPSPRAIIITQGVTGAGKSTITSKLIERLPAVRLRSDVERKRLAGVAPDVDTLTLFNAGIYSHDMTERTYARLEQLAQGIVEAGFVAIVDATFVEHEHRQLFAKLADRLDVPFVILDCEAPEHVLRQRVAERLARGDDVSDADLKVLDYQLASREPLTRDEQNACILVTPDTPLELDDLRRRIARRSS